MISDLLNINFVNPELLLLAFGIPLYFILQKYWKTRKEELILFSSVNTIFNKRTWKQWLSFIQPLFICLAYLCLTVAIARPQKTLTEEEVKAEGIDIMLVMDLSSSMLAQDFKPNRLEASKRVAIDFVTKRSYDRIGLVDFAGEAFTQCPLTTDHRILTNFLTELQCGALQDGTAIGMGMATAINRLKDSEAKSKIMILLTDGVNNSGYVKPITATEIAKTFGIKIYTIGVGSRGDAMAPIRRRSDGQYIFGLARVQMDEMLLTKIANETHGKYFRATSEETLKNIYDEIDQLEKTEINITIFKRYSDEYRKFLFLGILFIVLYFILNHTFFRSLP